MIHSCDVDQGGHEKRRAARQSAASRTCDTGVRHVATERCSCGYYHTRSTGLPCLEPGRQKRAGGRNLRHYRNRPRCAGQHFRHAALIY